MCKHTTRKRHVFPRRRRYCHFTHTIIAVTFLLVCAPAAVADEIYFSSGYSQTAVILRESDDNIRFMTEMGMSTVSKEKVSFIEKAAPEENQRLMKKWGEEKLKRKAEAEARKEAEQKFEQEQIARGLLKFEEKWMTPEEKQRILGLRKRAVEHRLNFEAQQKANGLVQFEQIWVTPALAEELREMEPEIFTLQDEILEQEEVVNSFRSAMLKISSLEEAEEFTKRIEETSASMDENIKKLNRLLRRADEIEATGVIYEVPEEFLDAYAAEEEEESE